MKIVLPKEINFILNRFAEEEIFAAVVGGCIRDTLLGKEPNDWDIATAASPDETKQIFRDLPQINTGEKHGTIGIVVNKRMYEITTFRKEGKYTDHRRPDYVSFTDQLEEDTARRDFTVNAMAYHPIKGLLDYHGGKKDLEAGKIRCVGDPDKRFSEDALRILRALRFASTLGYTIEENTAEAAKKHKYLLPNISGERKAAELDKILLGQNAEVIVREYCDILEAFLDRIYIPPEFTDIKAVNLALLLREGCVEKLRELKYDKNTMITAEFTAAYINTVLPSDKAGIKMLLSVHGTDKLLKLHAAKKALGEKAETDKIIKSIVENGECYMLRDLSIKGDTLRKISGLEGSDIGIVLNSLLEAVIYDKVGNDEKDLINYYIKVLKK